MRYDDRDNTKKLWGFISIVILSKRYEGFSAFLKKPVLKDSKSIHDNKDSDNRNNNDNNNTGNYSSNK